jgi:hypothetical protein
MKRIKAALVSSYSGAVLVGWLLAQGVLSAIGVIIYPAFQFAIYRQQASAFGGPVRDINLFDPSQLGIAALKTILTLGVSSLLLKWLYFPDKIVVEEAIQEPEIESPEE